MDTKQKKKILCVHGWISSTRVFVKLANELKDEYDVTLLGLPGFGRVPPTCSKLLSMIKYMYDYVANNEFDCIIAHSFGGHLLLQIMRRSSILRDKKVLLLSPVYGKLHRVIRWLTHLRLNSIQYVFPRPFVRALAIAITRDLRVVRSAFMEDLQNADPTTASVLLYEFAHEDYFDIPIDQRADMKIMYGTEDCLIPAKNILELAYVTDTPVVILPDVGHAIPEEGLTEIVKGIREWV